LFGSALFTYHEKKFEENALHKLRISSYADFYGRLYKSPANGQNRDYLFLKVEKISFQNREVKVQGNLRITLPRSSEKSRLIYLNTHDKIKISAQLSSFDGYRNFGPPSLEMHFKSQQIHKRAFSKSSLLVEKIEPGSTYSLLRMISILRQKLQEKIETHFMLPESHALSPQGAVLEALLLGERNRIDNSLSYSLQKAGLYHLFAISGAHIAIISFLLFSLFRLLRIPTRLSYKILMAFLIFYALLVEGRPSVMRATIMALAYLLGKLIWKDVNLLNTVSFSAFFLLLINPFQLFSLGFQLTFAATYSIIIFFPKIINFIPRIPLKISDIIALSLSAQLGVLPIVASAFNRVTFSSLLLNCAAIPLVGLIMACGYIFLLLSFVSTYLAQMLAYALDHLIKAFVSISHLFDSITFMSFRVPTPHFWIVIAYYVFFLLLLVPRKNRKMKFILSFGFILFLIILITYPFPSYSKNLKITFIDVGQGDSILVEFPGRKKMLIDGGGTFDGSYDIGERVVSPFLWKKGIKKIDYMILTHAHPDHLNGLISIARNFRVSEYWEAFCPQENENYFKLKDILNEPTLQKKVFKGHLNQIGDVTIEVLHPPIEESGLTPISNDNSIVLRLTYGKISFLLTGDIGSSVESKILKSDREIKSLLLKSPHHGSRSSSSTAFLKRLSPHIVVISVGQRNRFGHPNKEVLERYENMGLKIFRTDVHGAIEATSDGQKISIKTSIEIPSSP